MFSILTTHPHVPTEQTKDKIMISCTANFIDSKNTMRIQNSQK